MAARVARAIDLDERLLVEAGTGTGKTIAYLVPAILSGRRVVVSTGTRNLQDQIARSDLPRLMQVLHQPFTFAVMKGIGNYVCLRRLAEHQRLLSFVTSAEAARARRCSPAATRAVLAAPAALRLVAASAAACCFCSSDLPKRAAISLLLASDACACFSAESAVPLAAPNCCLVPANAPSAAFFSASALALLLAAASAVA